MNLVTGRLIYKSTSTIVGRILVYISAINRQLLVALLGKLNQPALSHIQWVVILKSKSSRAVHNS